MNESQTVEEYDRTMAEAVRGVILTASHYFKIDRKEIDNLILKLKEIGCGGIEKERLATEITGPVLKNCLDDLIEFLDEESGGVCIARQGDYQNDLVMLETTGHYYIQEYLKTRRENAN